jgi:undecaprenyl-diphosphatase
VSLIGLLARQFLQVVDVPEICGAAILLFVFTKTGKYDGLMYLLFLTMLYNAILKHMFKWPLPETCPGHGYGFPSGHTNFMTVFYVWIVVVNKNFILRFVVVVLWITSIISLVLAGYHYHIDVILAVPFSIFSIVLYKCAYRKLGARKTISIVIWSATAFLLILYGIEGTIRTYMAIAYGAIIGLSAPLSIFSLSDGWKLNAKIGMDCVFGLTIFAVLLMSSGTSSAVYLLSNFKFTMQFALIGVVKLATGVCLEKCVEKV